MEEVALRILKQCCVAGVLIIAQSKKIIFKLIFEFLSLGGVFLGVKNNSRNFGNPKNTRLFCKILS